MAWYNSRFDFGQGVAKLGNKLNLPDWSISEKLGGYNKTYDYQPGRIGWLGATKAKAAEPTQTSALYGPEQPADLTSALTQTSTQSTGTGTGTATVPQYAWWLGNKYDWNDAGQRDAYANARRDYINQTYDTKYGQQNEDINTSLANLGRNREWWNQDWTKQVDDLGTTKTKRDMGIGSYYSAIAPNMYQSAEGENLKESQSTYDQGIAEANRAKEQATLNFDQQQSGLNRDKANLDTWYNTSKQQELDQVSQMLDEAAAKDAQARISSASNARSTSYTPLEIMTSLTEYGNQLGAPVGSEAWRQGVGQQAKRSGLNLPDQYIGQLKPAAEAWNMYTKNIKDGLDPYNGLSSAQRQILASLGVS